MWAGGLLQSMLYPIITVFSVSVVIIVIPNMMFLKQGLVDEIVSPRH